MHKRKHTKLLHEGKYVAEIEIDIIDSEAGWSPYISLEDALKMDQLRELLRKGDIESAKKMAHIYIMKPVAA